jgi:hypothetical protein
MMIRVVSFPKGNQIRRSKLIACTGFTYFLPRGWFKSYSGQCGDSAAFRRIRGGLNACREIIFRTAGGGLKGFPGSRSGL